jgi:protein TonB
MEVIMYTRAKRFSPAGAGAALAVNGAVIAAMIFALAPNIVKRIHDPDPQIFTVPPDAPPPPPVDDTVKPRTDARVDPQIYQPPVDNPTHSENPIQGTETKPDVVLPIDTGIGTGTGETVVEKPVPPPLIGAVQDPRYARDFQPAYPSQGIRSSLEGNATVRVLIGVDGRVKAVEPVRASDPMFFEATRRQALAKWRFKPATRGGVPQESWKTMSVRFELSGE